MTSILIPWSLVSQLMELRAKMTVRFDPRQGRLPLIVLSQERLEKVERRSPQQTKCSPKRIQSDFLLPRASQAQTTSPQDHKGTRNDMHQMWLGKQRGQAVV